MQSSIVSKILAVLTLISEARKPLTFSELVAASGMNKSTIHRLLAICAEEGLVQLDAQHKTYLLGGKVFDLVRNAHSRHDVQTVALDEMLRLQKLFDANITIGVPSGLEVVYLRVLEARSTGSPVQQPGMREPIHCSASGKALFAYLPEKVVDARLAQHKFERFTERTITDADAFKAALEKVRRDGFAQNDREEYDYFCGISAPVFNYLAEPVAVLNIWSLHAQHPITEMVTWAGELMASAARVTALLGGVKPDLESLPRA